jgi:hypothetical protein
VKSEITDLYVSGKLHTVRQCRIVSDHAVVSEVNVRHDPIPVAESGVPEILRRSNIKRTTLSDNVVIADFQPCRLPCVFLVLRNLAKGNVMKNAISATDSRMTADHCMRTNCGAGTNLNKFTDNCVRSNLHICGQLR